MRELHEYVALRARHPDAAPIARVLGLVETDLGLGLVVERFQGPDGGLAPTLVDLCKEHGQAGWILQGAEALFRELADCHVVMSDAYNRHRLKKIHRRMLTKLPTGPL